MNIYFIANNTFGEGMSGGDRIWIELAKRWKNKANLTILGTPEARTRLNEPSIPFIRMSPKISPTAPFSKGFILKNALWRSLGGVVWVIKNWKAFKPCLSFEQDTGVTTYHPTTIYSTSDFFPDLLPCLVIKFLLPKTSWIAAYFLFAPPPFAKNNPYKGNDWLRGFVYWLMQRITYLLVNHFADVVFVTSQPDQKYFKKSIVVRGGVSNIPIMENWLKIYDAVFIGRFHEQKGVLELIEIWKEVVKQKPDAVLVMIGNGRLWQEVIRRRNDNGLQNNIHIVGFKDGIEKYYYLSRSRIMLHPATYDSGGMACAEGMAFGLPAIGFNLPAYDSYYSRGMLKAWDIKSFADCVIGLLTHPGAYAQISKDARELVEKEWTWDRNAKRIWNELTLS